MDDVGTTPRTRGKVRDRRGRGHARTRRRCPPSPARPALRTARQRFDQLVLDVVTPLDERWQRHLGLVEYAVEDTPMLPDDWGDETVPLSSLVRGKGQAATRLVIFRRPIEHRVDQPRRARGDGAHRRRRAARRAARPHARPGRREVRRLTPGLALGGPHVRHLAGRLQLRQRQHRQAAVARPRATATAPVRSTVTMREHGVVGQPDPGRGRRVDLDAALAHDRARRPRPRPAGRARPERRRRRPPGASRRPAARAAASLDTVGPADGEGEVAGASGSAGWR